MPDPLPPRRPDRRHQGRPLRPDRDHQGPGEQTIVPTPRSPSSRGHGLSQTGPGAHPARRTPPIDILPVVPVCNSFLAWPTTPRSPTPSRTGSRR
jgi:hypothetical protein